ncbi:MAG: sensor histidine kinase [Cellvibrionaceae bacterium]
MSLRLKTILGVGIIEAILLAILITTILNYMQRSSEEGLENYVKTTTTLFATTTKDAVLSFDLASLETFVEEILKNEGVLYVRIMDNNRNMLASGGEEEYLSKNFKKDENYGSVDDDIYDTETEIIVDDENYGSIEIGISTGRIDKSLSEARKLAAIIALLEMILVAMFSLALGIYLTKQLKVLRNSARTIAAGDLDHSIEIKSHDEVGEVAQSFNKMIISLNKANEETEKYHNELIELNTSLEDRVARRTHKVFEQKQKLETALHQIKVAQKQLVQSEKMASIGQLAAGVAHEINNPVAFVKSNINSLSRYIKSYQEVIQKQQAFIDEIETKEKNEIKDKKNELKDFWEEEDIDFINEDIETLLKESIDGTNRVEEIVKGLKVYSRASDDTTEACNLNDSLDETLKLLSNELKYKCDVIKKLNPLPLCLCDRSKMTQVFTNLIVNATHAMEDKGTLTIETHALDNNTAVQIKVSDTGKGIAKQNIHKLFDPFFTTKPVGQGTGLGLSISHGIIQDHQGTIEVESEVGVGTSFIITLPANNAEDTEKAL